MAWRFVAGAACALAVGGCDYIFRVDRLPTVGDAAQLGDGTRDGPHDGVVDDAKIDSAPPQQICSNPILDTSFNLGTSPCVTWGIGYSSNGALTLGTTSGLVITPQNQLDSVGGCYSNMNKFVLGQGGIYARVTDALVGAADSSTYTVLQVHNVEYQLKISGTGRIAFQTSGSQDVGMSDTFTPPMWLRIRPEGSSLSGAISNDGVAWRILGVTNSLNLPSTVDIEVSAGVNGGYMSGTGTFERLVVCP